MRKLKSIAVCALCLCLLLGLAGCAAAQRPLRVTLVLKTETDVAEFWGMLLSGVRKAAEEYGVELTVRTSPTETAIDEQIELIRQTAAEKPDVMILSAADYDRCAEATEEAIAAGIGVVAVDTDVNAEGRACFVGSNNYQIGQEMGSQMASYLPEGGKVAVIQHMLTTTTGIDRTRGVLDALNEAGNIDILGSFCCDNSTEQARAITTELLSEDPEIRGFVCTNEVCNVGAANALVELGMGGKVFVVGCDNSQRQIALLLLIVGPIGGKAGLQIVWHGVSLLGRVDAAGRYGGAGQAALRAALHGPTGRGSGLRPERPAPCAAQSGSVSNYTTGGTKRKAPEGAFSLQ